MPPSAEELTATASSEAVTDTGASALLLQQAQQENALLRTELHEARARSASLAAETVELRSALAASAAKVTTLDGQWRCSIETTARLERSQAMNSRLRTDEKESAAEERCRALEAQLTSCATACEAVAAARRQELEAEADRLRQACATHQGKALASASEAHEARMRVQEADARRQRLQVAVEELREELARALEEGCTASTALQRARAEARAAAEAAALREELLERRAAEAERRLEATPAERDAAIATLRRQFHDLSLRLHERTSSPPRPPPRRDKGFSMRDRPSACLQRHVARPLPHPVSPAAPHASLRTMPLRRHDRHRYSRGQAADGSGGNVTDARTRACVSALSL